MDAISAISPMLDKLKELELAHQKDLLESKKSLRGDREVAYDD